MAFSISSRQGNNSLVSGLLMAILLMASVVHALEALVVYDPAVQDLDNDVSLLNPAIATYFKDNSVSAEYKAYTDETLDLFFADHVKYNHVILLPASKKTMAKKSFNQHTLLDFIDQGGNVLIVGGDSKTVFPEDIKSFLNEFGVYPSPKGYKLFDHFNQNEDGSVKLTEANFVEPKVLPYVSGKSADSYNGGAALISNNEHILPLIRASSTSFTSPIDDVDLPITQDKTWTFGQQGFLAVGVQALNNARLGWVASESFVDEELLQWNFQEKGVLKLQFVQHYKHDEPHLPNNKTLYRIKDQVIYTVGVSEYSKGKWIPFEVKDEEETLQLAFKMLDPYQRLNLEPLGPSTSTEDGEVNDLFVYYTNFTLPDHHGMFTFELDYKRAGLSYLSDKRIVAVRHLANDEFKRSWEISNAWVYMASAATVIVTWFLFVINFVYIGNVDLKKKNI